MGKGYRKGRLGEEIRRIISDMLLRDIKDPRLSGLVSISAVDVTEDGSYATVYFTVFGNAKEEPDEEGKNEVLEAFKSAKGLMKREIGKQIKLRHVPELLFKMDTSLEYGRHISKLIHELGIEESGNEDE
ncbi:30S ribosome-binding factor RbfA [Sinanaerobacter chloroacetimidivorans]|jgi:ribosome-binding factor A|uniref:Ribosome-binding factor A n=1 Tax=Sinanaerobacter chloroacetimidivorans TaxID=2818044 RepID=A0A8J7VZB1_9FIRM|nr:30S ribosome-binding factor RbfA [Sinanaerobacter chloroacetimidivorans]MBR0596758.1 30S ribosome-binding factor RbfA [Sinanaerobacter chloroacetimidivorans]